MRIFRAIALCIYGNQNKWKQVRRDLANTLRRAVAEGSSWMYYLYNYVYNNALESADDIEYNLARWGEDLEIRLIRRTYNVNLVIEQQRYHQKKKRMVRDRRIIPCREPTHLDDYNISAADFEACRLEYIPVAQAVAEQEGEGERPREYERPQVNT